MFRPQERYFTVSAHLRDSIWPSRAGRISERRRRATPVLEIAGVGPVRTSGPIPALRRLGKRASEKYPCLTGVEHSPKQPVLRANSTRCFVPWQIVRPVRRAAILSGFSLRKKSIEFCAKV